MTPAITRWEQIPGGSGYGVHFAQAVSAGDDIDGEARFADTLAERSSTVLDAGCGMGRVAAYLREAGHSAYGIDLDHMLLRQARSTYPGLHVGELRLDEVSPKSLASLGFPHAYDLIVCVGNVMVFLAPGSEQAVLRALRSVLAPGGRMLVGFELTAERSGARTYASDDFVADADASGWVLESRHASYQLAPYKQDSTYAVHVLAGAATT